MAEIQVSPILSASWVRRIWALLLGVGAALAAAADDSLERVTLQLKWKHQFQFAGYYAAIEQGYYRDAGLEVNLREAELGEEPGDRVLAGEAEFGVAASDLVLRHARGEPVVALAPILQHSPLILLTKADGQVTSVHDLAGRKIMLEPHAEELIAYLQVEDITLDEIETVPHAFSPERLVRGEVAAMSAYATDEPFWLEKSGVPYMEFTPRSSGIDFYGDTLFTTREQVESHPDRVARFRAASLRGWHHALAHPEEMVDLIHQKYSQRHSKAHLRFEAEHFKRLVLPDVVDIGYQSRGRWQHIADTYQTLGMVEPGLSLDGFLYEDVAEDTDLSRLYVALVIASVVMGVMALVIGLLMRMNRKIRNQAKSLQSALGEIKELRGFIPICASCKKVRDDQGYWEQVETYIESQTRAEFTHCLCEGCMKRLYPNVIPDLPRED